VARVSDILDAITTQSPPRPLHPPTPHIRHFPTKAFQLAPQRHGLRTLAIRIIPQRRGLRNRLSKLQLLCLGNPVRLLRDGSLCWWWCRDGCGDYALTCCCDVAWGSVLGKARRKGFEVDVGGKDLGAEGGCGEGVVGEGVEDLGDCGGVALEGGVLVWLCWWEVVVREEEKGGRGDGEEGDVLRVGDGWGGRWGNRGL